MAGIARLARALACCIVLSPIMHSPVAMASGEPSRPRAVSVRVVGPQAIEIRWSPPSAGRPVLGYSVTANGSAGACSTRKLRCTIEGLAVDREHRFTVTARNSQGRGRPAISAPIYLPADASPDGFR